MVELEVAEQLISHPQLKIGYLESGGAAHIRVYKEKPRRIKKINKKKEKCSKNVNQNRSSACF